MITLSHRLFACALGAAMVLSFAGSVMAQTTQSFVSVDDATLYEDAQGDEANGAGTYMFAGHTGGTVVPDGPTAFRRRALVKFNLSAIPSGSTISSATLTMYVSRVSQSAAESITLHRMTADWGEGTSNAPNEEGQGAPATNNDATWVYRFYSGTPWTTPGGSGQFVSGASDTTSVGAALAFYSWTSATMATDVSGWVNNSANNFGWMIRGNEVNNNTSKRFNTHEHGTAAQRPTLSVTFTAPTGACCENGACTVMTQAACIASGGTYQGNGTDCSPNPCPPPTGACCTSNVCTIVTQASCTAGGGTYQGNGTDCTPDPCAAGIEATLSADRDNTLYQTTDGSQSNGAGANLIVGVGASLNDKRRATVRFDISSIPVNATITSATLRLFLTASQDTAARLTTVNKLLSSWGEGASNAAGNEFIGAASTLGDATWIHRSFPFTNWASAGGDYTFNLASSTATVGDSAGFYDFGGATMASDVQSWLTTPTNFGWLVRIGGFSEFSVNSQKTFASRNNGTASRRPQLVVRYTVPPPTGACCAADGTCTVMTMDDCVDAGRSYSGDNTTCSPNLCPQPTGSCCFTSGICNLMTEAACNGAGGSYGGHFSDCSTANCQLVLTPFVDALPIPSIMQPISGIPGGTGTYIVSIDEFNYRFHADLPQTRAWGYNSQIPGPTFETTRGFPVSVTWVNNLRTTRGTLRTTHILPVDTCLHGPDITGQVPVTVTHFHGGKVDPISDGNPDDAFPPGQSSPQYFYPNDQRASTLWYHDHALGITRLNVMMGLAGGYIIRDAPEAALNLPSGEYEIPLIIQDKSFNPDGSILYNQQFTDNFFGKFILVNGKVWPYLEVKRGKYRFRLVNGSNTRVYTLALSNNAPFQQIGSEQGLLRVPVTITSITIAPGERADIVVDFAAPTSGRIIGLVNSAPAPFPVGDPANDIPFVMQFVIQPTAGDTDPVPSALVPVPPIPEAQAVNTRSFTLRNVGDPECLHGLWLINDLMWHDVTDFPRVGTTEIWEFVNRSSISHPMHIHLVSFQILDRQNFTVVNNVPVPSGPRVPPQPGEAGWKDTVLSHPNQITRVIMKFEGFYGLYPFHCHILEHEDHEMMRLFDLLCDPPMIVSPPSPDTVPPGGTAIFTLNATGDALEYLWYRNNIAIGNGPTGTGAVISGSSTATLSIANAQPGDQAAYACRVFSPCGSQATSNVQLTVSDCPADFNHDGSLDPDDLADYIGAYFAQPPGTGSDFNGDGSVDPDDLADYIGAYFAGC